MINSLGENARRMLKIGRLQDELVKYGLKYFADSVATLTNDNQTFTVSFGAVSVHIFNWCKSRTLEAYFDYNSPTLQQDVLAKVKDLINE